VCMLCDCVCVVCVRACVRVCAHTCVWCVRACVCVCVCACAQGCMFEPIPVAARSKAVTAHFARIVGSSLTAGMDVCLL